MNVADCTHKKFFFTPYEVEKLRNLAMFGQIFSDDENKHIISIILRETDGRITDNCKMSCYIMFHPYDLDYFLYFLRDVAAHPQAPSFAKDFEQDVLKVLEVRA
jgi:hypothetical protein